MLEKAFERAHFSIFSGGANNLDSVPVAKSYQCGARDGIYLLLNSKSSEPNLLPSENVKVNPCSRAGTQCVCSYPVTLPV